MDTYYSFNIRLLTILGIWPHLNVHFRRIQSVVVNVVIMVLIIVQMAAVLHDDTDIIAKLQGLSFILSTVGSVVKFNSFVYRINAVKNIMDSIKSKWSTTHQATLDILEKRAVLGKRQGAVYAICLFLTLLFSLTLRTASSIMVAIAPANSNVTDPFPIASDYFIDGKKYVLLIAVHQDVAFVLMTIIYVGTETVCMLWLQHGISLYELSSYCIESGISDRPIYISQKVVNAYRKKCIANAVAYHNEAKAFLMYIMDRFAVSYLLLLLIAIASLSMNFYRLSTAICVTHNVQEMLIAFFYSLSELVYMFYINYVLQQALDYADDFPTIIYFTPWYKMSVSIQKSLLIILIKCSDPLVFDLYGFYNASIEGFSVLLRATVSYFMMITTMQGQFNNS